jgi:hypothetical protein
MKLQDHLPQGVFVDNKFYRLDFDFRNVLRMMEVLDRDDLMPEAKEFLALKCLTRHPRNVQKVLVAVRELLFQQKPKKDAKKVTDFEQDAGLIRAAFRQEFGIDLYRDKLHWIEFSEMLNAIPEGNRYAEVVGIRARPIPAPTKWNQHEREWLLKAKADVALHLSDAEQAKKYQEDVGKVFASLFGMIQKGSEIQNGE